MESERKTQCSGCNKKRGEIVELEHRIASLSPHLVNDERVRARAVWEAAYFAHDHARQGEPGPISVIAAALKDAENKSKSSTVAEEKVEDEG